MKDIKGVLTIVIIFVIVSIIWIIISNYFELKPVQKKIRIESIEVNLLSNNIERTFSFYNSLIDFNLINKNDSILIFQVKSNTSQNIIFEKNNFKSKLTFTSSNSFQNIREILDNASIKYSFIVDQNITFYDLDSNLIIIKEIK